MHNIYIYLYNLIYKTSKYTYNIYNIIYIYIYIYIYAYIICIRNKQNKRQKYSNNIIE